MSGNFGTGKRQREAEQTKKRQEKEQRRLAKRDRRPAEIEIVSADEIQGNLPSIEEAMAALENPGQVQRSAASIPARLFVGGVADDVSEQALRAVFEQYGNVAEVVIMKDRVTRARAASASSRWPTAATPPAPSRTSTAASSTAVGSP